MVVSRARAFVKISIHRQLQIEIALVQICRLDGVQTLPNFETVRCGSGFHTEQVLHCGGGQGLIASPLEFAKLIRFAFFDRYRDIDAALALLASVRIRLRLHTSKLRAKVTAL